METKELPLPHARANDIVIQELPDEVLVYDLKTHKAHCLNKTAAMVWKYCDGKTSVADIALLVKNDLNNTLDEATIWFAVERLSKANLLEKQVTTPAGSPRLGRRDAIRRLGLGSAIAVPVVMSILAPTALAGCTFPLNQSIGMACCTNAQCSSGCCGQAASTTDPYTCRPTNGAKNSFCTQPCQCTSGCNTSSSKCS